MALDLAADEDKLVVQMVAIHNCSLAEKVVVKSC